MYLPSLVNIKLTKNEKIIYDFLLFKRQSIFMYTEIDISNLTGVSQPTVSRFWKKIGFNNFRDFKEKVREKNNINSPSTKFKSIVTNNKFHYENYVNHSISLIEESAQKINNEDFDRAIEFFVNSNNIFTHGIGPAEFLSSLLIFRLSRFGLNISNLPSTGQDVYEKLLHTKDNDLFVLFLFSHYHPETYVLLDFAKKNNIRVILITDIFIKPMEYHNMVTIYVYRGELFEFHSLTGPLFLIESLIVNIGMLKEEESLNKLKKLEDLRKEYENYIPRNLK